METSALHLEVRNALSLSDELARYEHGLGNDTVAGHLAATRTTLDALERALGRSHGARVSPDPVLVAGLRRCLDVLRGRAKEIPKTLHPRFAQLLAVLERVVFAELSPMSPVPGKPVLRALPLRRILPEDAHSVIDYLSAAAYLLSAKLARTRRARLVGLVVGTKVAGVALVTDYRYSVAKVIPIELHELLDHASGAGAIAAPFVFGYAKRDPVASAIQILTGAFGIVVALLTDYRAPRGVGRAFRSQEIPRIRSIP